MSNTDMVELRGDVPKWVGSVFEGVRRGRGLTKDALLARILVDWAKKEIHVATLIERMTRGNACVDPAEGEDGGN